VKTALPILLLAGLVSGCEIWDPSHDLNSFFGGLGTYSSKDPIADVQSEEYRTWSLKIREAVDERRVLVGMTKIQVQAAMHLEEKPIQKLKPDSPNSKVESWIAWRLLKGWSYVKRPQSQMVTILFRDGVVAKITAGPLE